LAEAKILSENGAKELIIISQDSTKYGSDRQDGVNLAKLVKMLADSLPDVYFRIMYLNPDGVTEELINTISGLENVLRYFDIPIQHASDKILRAMNRHYTKSDIERVFSMIRGKLPEAIIRTTVIVGFPDETEADFEEVSNFLTNYKPDFAGFFAYSPEDGTAAADLPHRPEAKSVKKRVKTLQSIQKKNTVNRLKSMSKGEIFCFIERANDDFDFILEGRAFFQSPEIDGALYVTDGEATDGYGPYRAKITKIAYPDVYVTLLGLK
jgi:ribosomal protein S12 methylthiotransferase